MRNRSIALLFAGSGCAALIYEVVWFQTLQLVVGASAVSLAVLLGAFMGGMFAGSLLLARCVSPVRHPLRVLAAIEAAIAVCGLLLVAIMPLVGRLYTAVDGGGPSSLPLRALASLLLLLPPAMLMGATLPAIARDVDATPAGAARIGLFHGANIVGVCGSMAAGFYLLPVFDLATASFVAVAVNAVVCAAAFVLARRTPYTPPAASSAAEDGRMTADGTWNRRGVFAAIALSGFTALGAQVVWTRVLSLLFGATTYTFSLILAVFLAGLGAGNALGGALARRAAYPRRLLGWAQIGVAFAIAHGAWMAARSLPYWPVDIAQAPETVLALHTDLFRTALAVLPGAVLWGLSFPLAVAAGVRPRVDGGAAVGRVYAANTFGAVAGAVVTPLALVPSLGTQNAQRVLIATAAASACVALLPAIPFRLSPGAAPKRDVRRLASGTVFGLALLMAGIGAAAAAVPRVPAGLVAWGRLFPWFGEPVALYVGEGVNASVAVTEESAGWRNFHVSGKVEASTEPQDMRLQRLLGHLTALMHERPASALVVGFGAGVTAGAISIHPSIERLVICELEPLIPRVVARYFGDVNYDVVRDLKVRMVYDDARHYMMTSRETFDVITSDPIHPWVKGAATLYTKEYFEHVRRRLNPGGIATQWVPLYESTDDSVRSVIATFLQVFPDALLWRNDDADGSGYDAVLVGRVDGRPIDVDAWQARVDGREHEKVRNSLAEVGFETIVDVLATYLGRGRDLAPWLAGADINTDRNLRLQYLAGAAVNRNSGTGIRNAILRYRRFPEDLLTGHPDTLSALRQALEHDGAR